MSLRSIKKRLNNVAVIEKITQSMKAVSTSKLAGAKSMYSTAMDYFTTSKSILNMLLQIYADNKYKLKGTALDIDIFTSTEQVNYKKTLVVAIASDRGLCGSYNSNIFKAITRQVENVGVDNVYLLPIGARTKSFMNKFLSIGAKISPVFLNSDSKKIDSKSVVMLSHYIHHMVVNSEVERVVVVYTLNKSILQQEVQVETIFPIGTSDDSVKMEHSIVESKEEIDVNIVTDIKYFEESINELLIQYFYTNIYEKMIDSSIAEYASRLNAMHGAHENSNELMKLLKLEYNRTRQDIITKELIEIVAGADAI